MKRKRILILFAITFLLAGCGNDDKEVAVDSETVTITETTGTTESLSEIIQETEVPDLADLNAEELLDLFIEGELIANYNNTDWDPFYITELPLDVEDDWYSYSIGNRVDLDNDGEQELILDGPYGGIYLDARDGQIFVLDFGDGTAATLRYTEFDGQTWIVHGDTTHGGRIIYDFKLYDGTGQVVDEFRLGKEFWEYPDEPDGPNTVYTYRNEEISKEKYDALKEKMLGEAYLTE